MNDDPPDTFGHYRVALRPRGSAWELGRGSMGITYKAHDVHLDCAVALKVINTGCGEALANEQIVREARLAAQLRHRNIATVFFLGLESDRCFYAMELIDGATVESLVKRDGPMSPRAALHVARQVASALGAAARQGVVHRDIKPANIMILDAEEEDGPVVKVIDFGLVCPTRGEARNGTGFAGTAQYASPEQAQEQELDIRSDFYSLGCTLWFLLTGAPPFTGSLARVLSHHLQSEPPWSKLPPVSKPLRSLLAHLLQKDPAKRPATPTAARAEIERCLAVAERQEALAARLAGFRSSGRRWLLAPPRTYAAGAACALPIFFAALLVGRNFPSEPPRSAGSPAPAISRQDYAIPEPVELLPDRKPFWSSGFVRRILLEEEARASRLYPADATEIPRDLGAIAEARMPTHEPLWDAGVPRPREPWGGNDTQGVVSHWALSNSGRAAEVKTAVAPSAPKAEKRRTAGSSPKRRTSRSSGRRGDQIDVLASLEKARRSIRGFVRQIF